MVGGHQERYHTVKKIPINGSSWLSQSFTQQKGILISSPMKGKVFEYLFIASGVILWSSMMHNNDRLKFAVHASYNITSHYITLHHTVSHCITLHHIISHCITLHRIASHYITLYHITSHCITLHHIISHCITLHHIASHCITLHHTASHCMTLHDIAFEKNTQLPCNLKEWTVFKANKTCLLLKKTYKESFTFLELLLNSLNFFNISRIVRSSSVFTQLFKAFSSRILSLASRSLIPSVFL